MSDCRSLATFRETALALFQTPNLVRGDEKWPEYWLTWRRRRWCFDLLDRLETIDYSFSRLQELSIPYSDEQDFILNRRTRADGGAGIAESIERRERAELEARTLTSLLYYEISSVATILKEFGIRVSGEIRYVVLVRGLFLAHPLLDSAIRNSRGWLQAKRGEFLHAAAINPGEHDPRLQDYLCSQLGISRLDYLNDWRPGCAMNRKLIESGKQHSRWSQQEKWRLQLYGIPEPNLLLTKRELVELLHVMALPKIQEVATLPMYLPSVPCSG